MKSRRFDRGTPMKKKNVRVKVVQLSGGRSVRVCVAPDLMPNKYGTAYTRTKPAGGGWIVEIFDMPPEQLIGNYLALRSRGLPVEGLQTEIDALLRRWLNGTDARTVFYREKQKRNIRSPGEKLGMAMCAEVMRLTSKGIVEAEAKRAVADAFGAEVRTVQRHFAQYQPKLAQQVDFMGVYTKRLMFRRALD